ITRIALGIVLTVGAVIPIGGYFLLHQPDRPSPPTAVARIERIEETVLASGIIAPIKLVSVGAQASGRILALHVALGDEVRKAHLIAEIDPSTEKNALATAEPSLEQIKAHRASSPLAVGQAELAHLRTQVTYPQEASS